MSTMETPAGQMFDHFKQAKNRKVPPWAAPLMGACALFVFALLASMWIKTIWGIEQLEPPKTSIDLAVAPPPPPPPPPPPGGAKPHDVVITPKKRTVKDMVQPVKIEKQEQKQASEVVGVEGGEEGGVEGGVVGGDINGVMGAPPPPPPPPPPAPPTNVAPQMLEGSRIAGEKQISPEDTTKIEIQRSGKDKVVGSFKLCLNVSGEVTTVNMLKSTGFVAYDQKILSKIRGEWRYRPYMVNGKPVPVCTAVTFIYSQH
jgi:protein TonB